MSYEDFPPAATLRQDDTLWPKEPRLSSFQAAVYASTNRFLPCGRKTPNQEHRPPYTPTDAPIGHAPEARTPLPEHRTARCPARTLRICALGSKDSRHRRGNRRMLRHTQIDRIAVRQYFGLAGSRVGFASIYKQSSPVPARRRGHVRIKQNHVLVPRTPRHCLVITFGKAVVLGKDITSTFSGNASAT